MIETLSILLSVINMLLSHAADGLWIAGDLGGLFDRPIRKQGIKVLGRDAADLVHAAHSRHDAPFLEVLVDEIEDFPMRVGEFDALFLGKGSGDIAVPLRVIGHLTFVVDVDGHSGNLFLCHMFAFRCYAACKASTGMFFPTQLIWCAIPGAGTLFRSRFQ